MTPTKQHKKETFSHFIFRVLMILVGAASAAVSIELFLIPNDFIDGGIIGVSLILDHLFMSNPFLNFALFVVILNIPFMIFGYKYIGKTFLISTMIGIVGLAVIESSLHHVEAITTQPILATVFGGLLLGFGVGLVIRNGGSMDGTEILGILLTKKLPFSVGEFVMLINVFIFIWAVFVFGPEQAMYSFMTYYIAMKTIDAVIQGLDETKAVIIVSDQYDEISDAILHRLGRGTTKLKGKGGYTDEEKDVIYAVVTRLEVTKLKSIVFEVDQNAFITIMNTHETRGGKFKNAIH
ncbi:MULTISPECIES: YitT family protein [unclassified Bacillus (in: firmicutes)]|uniref:YitT family protein n=1 Tax=unclassified Bacillus (in: firmicutes) TaxID=185979 RepID=UPI00227E0512|nr:YitT family protein [Bacillus sp. S20C3]MCY8205153.1 YitT family protein [Bacillus sp. N12A5]MCY8289571.1 YitT family protein [Bacillus sp. N13C7]MCY8639734.1 YitT family protein [Bacillus sp. S17B2]MCY8720274.1 YitT family protein [Bacillus sp. S10C12M]MCY9144175.1 YitT family protein [Bacillus sp. T9C1]